MAIHVAVAKGNKALLHVLLAARADVDAVASVSFIREDCVLVHVSERWSEGKPNLQHDC